MRALWSNLFGWPPRVMEIFPNMGDGTSYYRGAGPFGSMKGISHSMVGKVDWSTLSYTDILFMQRPWGPQFALAAEVARWNNRPVWLDFDDDVLRIPVTNPAKKVYTDEFHPGFKDMLSKVDLVTVSTEAIATHFREYAKDVRIIPNALNEHIHQLPFSEGTEKIVLWRGGSATHQEDLKSVLEDLKDVALSTPDWRFVFVGHDAHVIQNQKVPNFERLASTWDIVNYFHKIREMSPKILISPLEFNEFNIGKSNIAAIEATFAGAVCIAPDMPEWRIPGCLTYQDPKDFARVLKSCLNGEIDLSREYKKACKWVASERLLSKVNKQRRSIIHELMR